MSHILDASQSPAKKARTELPTLTVSSPGGKNADVNAYIINEMSTTMTKAKLIFVKYDGGLFIGGTALFEFLNSLNDKVGTFFCIAKQLKIPKDVFTRPDGEKYPYSMNGWKLNGVNEGMAFCAAVLFCHVVLLTNCMILTNEGLIQALEKTFMENVPLDFKDVTMDIGFRAIDDGKLMLEKCMSVIIEKKLVEDIDFLKSFAEFRLCCTANIALEDYQAKYDAIKDTESYKAMLEAHTKTHAGRETTYFTPFLPCTTTLFEYFFALLPKEE